MMTSNSYPSPAPAWGGPAIRPTLSLCLVRAVIVFSVLLLAACKKAPTPTPRPSPTPAPTPTPDPKGVLDGSLFTITFEGNLLASEEIHVEQGDGQLLILSEKSRLIGHPLTERRTVVLSQVLNPLRYDLEMSALGVHSIWVGERDGEVMHCLNNNLDWYAPVFVEDVGPTPQMMLEGSPSALPFALLALRYRGANDEGEDSPIQIHCLDILEDYPESRPLAVTVAAERQGAVIGTLALEGQIEGGANPRFTMWIRPGSRLLYSVEIADFRFGFWQQRAYPLLRGPGKLVIKRVSKLPQPTPAPPKGEAKRIPLEFAGSDNTLRSGTLILPAGEGPFPCLVAHSPGGVVPRWDPGDTFAQRGWAVYCYDKAGLGESKGTYQRGPTQILAGDAAAAAAMLRGRPEIEPGRIVFMGLSEGGQVGALTLPLKDAYNAAILGSCAVEGPLFPALAEQRIRHLLAPFYGWSEERLDAYEKLSVRRWQEWLFEGKDQVSFLRRRASIRALRDQADIDLFAALSSSQVPVLLLHGEDDAWTPVKGARALQERLAAAGVDRVSLQVFEGLGADLGGEETEGTFAPQVEEVLFAWLEETR